MVTRALTSWLLCVLLGVGALAPRALGARCCGPDSPVATQTAADSSDCGTCCEKSAPAEPQPSDQPCPDHGACPKACCAAPAPVLVTGVPALLVFSAAHAGAAPVVPQTTASPAHALSLLRPPRL